MARRVPELTGAIFGVAAVLTTAIYEVPASVVAWAQGSVGGWTTSTAAPPASPAAMGVLEAPAAAPTLPGAIVSASPPPAAGPVATPVPPAVVPAGAPAPKAPAVVLPAAPGFTSKAASPSSLPGAPPRPVAPATTAETTTPIPRPMGAIVPPITRTRPTAVKPVVAATPRKAAPATAAKTATKAALPSRAALGNPPAAACAAGLRYDAKALGCVAVRPAKAAPAPIPAKK